VRKNISIEYAEKTLDKAMEGLDKAKKSDSWPKKRDALHKMRRALVLGNIAQLQADLDYMKARYRGIIKS
jgi:hypothetical protein